jgi:hypothetical protein
MALVVKHWVADYAWDITSTSASPQTALSLRQSRYEGLSKWGLPSIVSFIPIQLICSVILFFSGIVYLTFTLNRIVFVVSAIFVGMGMLFLLVTTVLLTIFDDCVYRSPQAWFLRQVFLSCQPRKPKGYGWSDVVLQTLTSPSNSEVISRALLWMHATFESWNPLILARVWTCACELSPSLAARTLCELFSQTVEATTSPGSESHARNLESMVGPVRFSNGFKILLDTLPIGASTLDQWDADRLTSHLQTFLSMFRILKPTSESVSALVQCLDPVSQSSSEAIIDVHRLLSIHSEILASLFVVLARNSHEEPIPDTLPASRKYSM